MKKTIYPYKFVVESKERVWGGSTLARQYGKPSQGDKIGENWEICGFEDDSSVIANGYLAENALFDVIETGLIWASLILTIVSLVDYVKKNIQVLTQGGM